MNPHSNNKIQTTNFSAASSFYIHIVCLDYSLYVTSTGWLFYCVYVWSISSFNVQERKFPRKPTNYPHSSHLTHLPSNWLEVFLVFWLYIFFSLLIPSSTVAHSFANGIWGISFFFISIHVILRIIYKSFNFTLVDCCLVVHLPFQRT